MRHLRKSSNSPRSFLSSVGYFQIIAVCRRYGSFFYFGRICFWQCLNRRYSTKKKLFLLFKAHFDHIAFLVTIERKMTATNNRMFGRLDEIGSFNLNKFNPLSLQTCVFWNVCIVCPVLFELPQNWTTQRFTIMKKLNVFDQIVSTKIVTRPTKTAAKKIFTYPTRLSNEAFDL